MELYSDAALRGDCDLPFIGCTKLCSQRHQSKHWLDAMARDLESNSVPGPRSNARGARHGVCHWQPPELALMFSRGYFGGKPVSNNVGHGCSLLYHRLTRTLLPTPDDLRCLTFSTGLPPKKPTSVIQANLGGCQWHTLVSFRRQVINVFSNNPLPFLQQPSVRRMGDSHANCLTT